MLKNVHLAPGWLMQLEKKLHSLQPHACFRLFLTMEINPKVMLILKYDALVQQLACRAKNATQERISLAFSSSCINGRRTHVARVVCQSALGCSNRSVPAHFIAFPSPIPPLSQRQAGLCAYNEVLGF